MVKIGRPLRDFGFVLSVPGIPLPLHAGLLAHVPPALW